MKANIIGKRSAFRADPRRASPNARHGIFQVPSSAASVANDIGIDPRDRIELNGPNRRGKMRPWSHVGFVRLPLGGHGGNSCAGGESGAVRRRGVNVGGGPPPLIQVCVLGGK